MKFITALLLTALLSYAACLFFPWWSIAVAALCVAVFMHQKPANAFISAFLALFLLWAIQCFIIDMQNEHLLSRKVAAILPLGGSSIGIILVTAFVGALVAGLAALTGSFAITAGSKTSIKQRS